MERLNNNEKALLTLVRAGLWKEEAQLKPYSSIDYASLMQLAEEQSVVGLATAGFEQVKDSQIPKEWTLQFIGSTLQIEQRNKEMNAFVADLISRMRRAGIYTLLVKGQGIAQCYEKPSWRACGDVDLFLSDDNYEKAKAFLIPLASAVEKEYEREKHLGMTINGWVVELHGRLYSGLSSRIERELDEVQKDTFYGEAVRSMTIKGSWTSQATKSSARLMVNGSTSESSVQVFLLKVENDVFYVFTHILQHFYKEGVGLRQICDWCRLLWTYRDKFDMKLLESRLRKAGLMSEWRAFGAYAVEYLGMPAEAMPFYSDGGRWKRKAKRINKFVLNVGNMGHNRENSYRKYPYLIRKCFSAFRRMGDLFNHAMIFPLDSFRFSFAIMRNGVKSAIKGEG